MGNIILEIIFTVPCNHYFKYYAKLQVLLFLQIRKQAIKDLPSLCKENKEHTPRIADILAQLLLAQDPSELDVVHNSIMTLMKSDPKGVIGGFFMQILNGEDGIRERCIKFLGSKLKSLGRDIMTKDTEDALISECKKVLQVNLVLFSVFLVINSIRYPMS